VVRLAGVIGFSTPLRPGLTLAGIARSLDRAFAVRNAPAVALAINSPGGSPVQSHLIFRRIRELAAENNRRVIAFVEDAAASGGYMIACAADEIIADPHSIVGSIGVVGGSFGFDKAIAKIGIERRLYTSGEHKATLDPFLPENPDDVARLKKLQQEIHDSFIALVKSRRGAKLSGPENDLFSGEYWAGQRALELGLVDAIGDLRAVLRERFGDKVVTSLISAERGWLGRRVPGVGGLGRGELPQIGARLGAWGLGAGGLGAGGLAEDLISALEARALWARYGL
jgi:signal peptide peptidase SppA